MMTAPADHLLAIFDDASAGNRADIHELLAELALACGIIDPEGFARQWDTLIKGSIVATAEGDLEAPRHAQELGKLLLARHGVAYGAA